MLGDGCVAFYSVEPRGYVCLDARTTLDPSDPAYVAVKHFAPKLDTPFPHFYGESHGAPRYFAIPNVKEQHRREYQLDEHLKALEALRNGKLEESQIPYELVGIDTRPAGKGPDDFFRQVPPHTYEERDYIGPGSMIAWVDEFDAEGRTWLVMPDFAFMPKDKIKVHPRSEFRGVHLDEQVKLPIAFVRARPRPQYGRKSDGSIAPTGEQWSRISWVALTGEVADDSTRRYYVTRTPDRLIAVEDATVVRPSPRTPWGTPVEGAQEDGGAPQTGRETPAPSGRRTWIEVSILSGWMIAYVDVHPVFATLIAPGRGGTPVPGVDPVDTASTPTGTFRVDGKLWTGTMVNRAWVHADVPFILNFHGPHALHMAYWHDAWGEKTSGGCINLSPEDARWLFRWSEPPIPPGWHGMRSDLEAGPATVVVVHR